jgi:hypothetical protein
MVQKGSLIHYLLHGITELRFNETEPNSVQ